MGDSTNSESDLEYLEKLKRKAEITRNAHAYTGEKYGKKSKLMRCFVIIGAAMSSSLIFADYAFLTNVCPISLNESVLRFFAGLLALIVFIVSLLELVFRHQEKSESHYQSLRLFTSLIREIDKVKKTTNSKNLKSEIESLTQKYNWINEVSPTIPDKYFLNSKREYLRKRKISEALDKNPFKSIKQIEQNLSQELNQEINRGTK